MFLEIDIILIKFFNKCQHNKLYNVYTFILLSN